MTTSSGRVPLIGALLLYFLIVAALIAVVPWSAAPDEAAHAQYIEAIVSSHALPVFNGQSPPNPGYEFHQPPLFYLAAAPLWAILPPGIENYATRVLSLVFGLLTIWIVWNAANLIFGRGSRASAFCTLGAALSPLHQGVGASVNNDALAGLWSACLFYLVARAWLETPTRKLIIMAGVVAGLGALTKLTALPMGLWAFIAIGAALSKRGERPIPSLLPALVIALLLAAPMLLRNQFLYGDPFAYVLFSRAATQGTPGFADWGPQGFPLATYVRGMVWQILGTTWGFFGGVNNFVKLTGPLNASGPRFPDPLWLLPFSVTVFAPLMGIWSAWKNRDSNEVQDDEEEPYDIRSVSLWWAAGASLLFVLWVSFAYAHFSGGQARYLHGLMVPITLLVAGGLSRSRGGVIVSVLLGIVMLGLSLSNIIFWKTLV
ncbi:hypothetical protein EON83_09250 [bacterium]|nr:MAG: hypothetical protein EON83_09250 [bacterium]